MKKQFLILMAFIITGIFASTCLDDRGPFYVNPCPCDTTPFKDCDCDTDTLSVIYYEYDVQPIWDKYCIECHDGITEPTNLKTGYSFSYIIEYVNIEIPEASKVYQMMYMNVMPPEEDYRPTNDELDIVLAWIIQGAKNN